MHEGKPARIAYIDALKGFAILCVVLGHMANGYLEGGPNSPVYFGIYNLLYAFHMPLFLLLSGVTFQKAYLPDACGPLPRRRIGMQILNLTWLYVLWSLLLGISKMLFGGFVNNAISLKMLALIPVKPIQLFWYLFVLILFYTVFGILGAARLPFWLMLPLTLGLSLLSTLVPADGLFDLKRVLFHAVFFYLGTQMERIETAARRKEYRLWLRLLLLMLVAAALVCCILCWNSQVPLRERFPFNTLIGLGLSLGFYFLFRTVRPLGESRFLSWLGKESLVIFLLHTFFLTAYRAGLSKLGIGNLWLQILPALLIGVLLPLLVAWICRKLKIDAFFFAPRKFLFAKTSK